MQRDFETLLVRLCAPTLAGLKPANLFRFEMPDFAGMQRLADHWQAQLAPRGIAVRVLKSCRKTGAHLIYVYRPAKLAAILQQRPVRAYLAAAGYPGGGDEAYLQRLSDRLCCDGDFPHEIGLFLGYPLRDVVGFVENRGKNYTCCGDWKTYGDPTEARQQFARYRKCTEVYLRCFEGGTPISRLAVAV